MYAAFNTLQSELERLVLLKESITISGQASNNINKINELDYKILSHQKALKIILRQHFAEHHKLTTAMQGVGIH